MAEIVFENNACVIVQHDDGERFMYWKHTDTVNMGLDNADIADRATEIVMARNPVKTRVKQSNNPDDNKAAS